MFSRQAASIPKSISIVSLASNKIRNWSTACLLRSPEQLYSNKRGSKVANAFLGVEGCSLHQGLVDDHVNSIWLPFFLFFLIFYFFFNVAWEIWQLTLLRTPSEHAICLATGLLGSVPSVTLTENKYHRSEKASKIPYVYLLVLGRYSKNWSHWISITVRQLAFLSREFSKCSLQGFVISSFHR